MKPSKIMRKAANEFLWDGLGPSPDLHVGKKEQEHSCWAIEAAAQPMSSCVAISLAIDAGAHVSVLVEHFWPPGAGSQSARFMFLHLLALVLEEEG